DVRVPARREHSDDRPGARRPGPYDGGAWPSHREGQAGPSRLQGVDGRSACPGSVEQVGGRTMKSANWMAFYIGDYVKNTLKLTTQQHGAYLLLILACWQGDGSVDGDDETLACITKLSMADWLGARPKLASYFEVTPEKWTHRRVLE